MNTLMLLPIWWLWLLLSNWIFVGMTCLFPDGITKLQSDAYTSNPLANFGSNNFVMQSATGYVYHQVWFNTWSHILTFPIDLTWWALYLQHVSCHFFGDGILKYTLLVVCIVQIATVCFKPINTSSTSNSSTILHHSDSKKQLNTSPQANKTGNSRAIFNNMCNDPEHGKQDFENMAKATSPTNPDTTTKECVYNDDDIDGYSILPSNIIITHRRKLSISVDEAADNQVNTLVIKSSSIMNSCHDTSQCIKDVKILKFIKAFKQEFYWRQFLIVSFGFTFWFLIMPIILPSPVNLVNMILSHEFIELYMPEIEQKSDFFWINIFLIFNALFRVLGHCADYVPPIMFIGEDLPFTTIGKGFSSFGKFISWKWMYQIPLSFLSELCAGFPGRLFAWRMLADLRVILNWCGIPDYKQSFFTLNWKELDSAKELVNLHGWQGWSATRELFHGVSSSSSTTCAKEKSP